MEKTQTFQIVYAGPTNFNTCSTFKRNGNCVRFDTHLTFGRNNALHTYQNAILLFCLKMNSITAYDSMFMLVCNSHKSIK